MTGEMYDTSTEEATGRTYDDFELGPMGLLGMLAMCAWPGLTVIVCWLYFMLSWEVYDGAPKPEPLWTWFLYGHAALVVVCMLGLGGASSATPPPEDAPQGSPGLIGELVVGLVISVVIQAIAMFVMSIVMLGITDLVYGISFAIILPTLALVTGIGTAMATSVVEKDHPWVAQHRMFFVGLYVTVLTSLVVLTFASFAGYFSVVVMPPSLADGASMVDALSAHGHLGRMVLTEYFAENTVSIGIFTGLMLLILGWLGWEVRGS